MDRAAQIEKVACEVFSQVRTSIVLKMRFLDLAVFNLKPVSADINLATDGKLLYYRPTWILNKYHEESNAVVRAYMHVMLHCIFRHPFISSSVSKDIWDLSCDIAAEAIIIELNQQIMSTKDEIKKGSVIKWLQSKVDLLSAEKLFRYFLLNPPNSEWFELFKADDHSIWHNPTLRRTMRMDALQKGKESKDRSQENESKSSETSDNSDKNSSNRINKQSTTKNNEKKQDLQSNNSSGSANSEKENSSNSDGTSDSTNGSKEAEGSASEDSSLSDTDEKMDGDISTSEGSGENRDSNTDSSDPEENCDNSDSSNPSTDNSEGNGMSSTNKDVGGSEHGDRSLDQVDNLIQNGNGFGTQAVNQSQQYDPSELTKQQGQRLKEERASYGFFDNEGSYLSDLESNWKDISEHIQMDLETFAKKQGYEAGSLCQMLQAINREKYDYETFLRKFAVLGEEIRINDDEFDYVFYTYGLKLFGNMPLIEPLEYKEVKKIREFVIAIDTSGSTSGQLVNTFLTKTYNILLNTDSFFTKVNIYIIQCDAEIQECVRIQKKEDFENYIAQMTVKGQGGTDFRPVFKYVDELVQNKQFTNLKGMIYFTDGYGTFPAYKPKYQTAFVFIQESYYNPKVPPWAIKLVLEKEEI